jgi:hypothetical protein
MTKDLSAYSFNDLRAELQRREDEEKERKREAWSKRIQFLTDHVDALLELISEHGRTSCSDDDPCNKGRCHRCTVLSAQKDHYWDSSYDVEISIVRREME